jgi:hypothetical protein
MCRPFMALAFVVSVAAIPSQTLRAQDRLADKAQYQAYIDPLVTVKDFGIDFSDSGAADVSIVQPFHWDSFHHIQYDRPPDAVIALAALAAKAVPLLIDCLDDGRLTAARFSRTSDNTSMNVPVGYLCMDILNTVIEDERIKPQECNRDGLGWCIHDGFYFRPDAFDCKDRHNCTPLPVVTLVQRNWRQEFVQFGNSMRFDNQFDNWRSSTTDRQTSGDK